MLTETIPGMRAVAQRIANAENDFVDVIMERGFTREQAVRAMHNLRKFKMAKLDPVLGRISVTHGSFLEVDVLQAAADYQEAGHDC